MRKPVLLARSVYNCKPLTMEEFYVGPFIARIYTTELATSLVNYLPLWN